MPVGQLYVRNMSELERIKVALERAAQRRRLEHALRGLWWGLLAGACIYILALAVFKLAPVQSSILVWSAYCALVCPFAGAALGFWRKPDLTQTARWVDVKQNLKE